MRYSVSNLLVLGMFPRTPNKAGHPVPHKNSCTQTGPAARQDSMSCTSVRSGEHPRSELVRTGRRSGRLGTTQIAPGPGSGLSNNIYKDHCHDL
ncbi:MAG TPA: hypothetical protein PLP19_03620 [bacterium]|nr:hypothetical protein [bacterium]HPN42556.1 hypothetical protein [bacterium]